VAVVATLGTVLFGSLVGVIAGFWGGWLDALLSRLADVFFGIPFVLGAIVILFTFNTPGSGRSTVRITTLVIIALVTLTWPVSMRIMRSSVLSTKQADYIVAARALGASNSRIIFKHLVPNCLAPVLVYATILVGAFIGAEATLSFLGVGLQSPVVSWGVIINESQNYIRVAPYWLLFPAAFLVTAVLSFVMLGEAGLPRRPAALPARPALPGGPVAGARPVPGPAPTTVVPVVPQVPEQRPRRLR
jgi:oligopeptide transport system permease protein